MYKTQVSNLKIIQVDSANEQIQLALLSLIPTQLVTLAQLFR